MHQGSVQAPGSPLRAHRGTLKCRAQNQPDQAWRWKGTRVIVLDTWVWLRKIVGCSCVVVKDYGAARPPGLLREPLIGELWLRIRGRDNNADSLNGGFIPQGLVSPEFHIFVSVCWCRVPSATAQLRRPLFCSPRTATSPQNGQALSDVSSAFLHAIHTTSHGRFLQNENLVALANHRERLKETRKIIRRDTDPPVVERADFWERTEHVGRGGLPARQSDRTETTRDPHA